MAKNIVKGPAGDTWIDEDGIVCFKSKKRPLYNEDVAREQMEIIYNVIGNKRVCLLADLSETSALTQEARNYYASSTSNHFKAVALVATSLDSKLAATAVATAQEQPFPVLLTEDIEEARTFLKKYL